jgi:hypothetical protein
MTTLGYPIQSNNGNLQLVLENERLIPQVVTHILQTKQEERVMNPEFGIGVNEFTNAYNLSELLGQLDEALNQALTEYPGVLYKLLGYLDDSGQVEVTCLYYIDELAPEASVTLVV